MTNTNNFQGLTDAAALAFSKSSQAIRGGALSLFSPAILS